MQARFVRIAVAMSLGVALAGGVAAQDTSTAVTPKKRSAT